MLSQARATEDFAVEGKRGYGNSVNKLFRKRVQREKGVSKIERPKL